MKELQKEELKDVSGGFASEKSLASETRLATDKLASEKSAAQLAENLAQKDNLASDFAKNALAAEDESRGNPR